MSMREWIKLVDIAGIRGVEVEISTELDSQLTQRFGMGERSFWDAGNASRQLP